MHADGVTLCSASAAAASPEAAVDGADGARHRSLKRVIAERAEALCESIAQLHVECPQERSRPLSAAFRISPSHVGTRLPVLEVIGDALAEPLRRVIQACHCTPQEIDHDRLLTTTEHKRPPHRTLFATPPVAQSGPESHPS